MKYNLLTLGSLVNLYSYYEIQILDKEITDRSHLGIKELQNQIDQILLMTYRSNFSPIYNSTNYFTSDCGWGCMIRVSQMLLATAIYKIKLKTLKMPSSQLLKNEVILLFIDNKLPIDTIRSQFEFSKVLSNIKPNKRIMEEIKEEDIKADVRFNNNNILEEKFSKENEYEIVHHNSSFTNSNDNNDNSNGTSPKKIRSFVNNHTHSNNFLNNAPMNSISSHTLNFSKAFNNKNNKIRKTGSSNGISNNFDSIRKDDYSFVIIDNDITLNSHNFITPPISIQNICSVGMGLSYQRNPGEWYSDISSMQILKELAQANLPEDYLKILYFQEGYINEEEIISECFTEILCKCEKQQIEDDGYEYVDNRGTSLKYSESQVIQDSVCKCFISSYKYKEFYYKLKSPGILLVSIRLGLDTIDKTYYDKVFDLFNVPGSIGFAGGKPNRALYFIGVWKKGDKDKKLIYLDPHLNQEACPNKEELEELYYKTYIPKDFYVVDISKISPSLTCGFQFSNLEEYKDLILKLNEISNDKNGILKFGDVKSLRKSYSESDLCFTSCNESITTSNFIDLGGQKNVLLKNFHD